MSKQQCECLAAGFCSRRQSEIPEIHFQKCKTGAVEHIDSLYLRPVADQVPQKRRLPRTRYGNRLAEIIARKTGEHVDCAGCDNEIGRLNGMTADEILQQKDSIADGILIRGASKARTWWQRVACRYAPEILKAKIHEWIIEAINAPGIIVDEKWSMSRRHLTFHIYPTSHHDSWQWNLQQLAIRWEVFNGKKAMAIAVDQKTVKPSAVVDYAKSIGVEFDYVIQKTNSRNLREVITWYPMLEAIGVEAMNADDAVFSCHAKGVRHQSRESQIVGWASLMYQTCLDYMPLVDKLMQSHASVGSFRRYGDPATPINGRWDYAGTFFWWKPHELCRRKWRKIEHRFYGTESWLGLHLGKDEAAGLFLDNCDNLYEADYWVKTVWPAWEIWKAENEKNRGTLI